MIAPLIIFGATGVGKTTLLNSLYSYWSTNNHFSSHVSAFEVIVADSRQVYKNMPISTAQADTTLRTKVRHHLAETLDYFVPYTVGSFITQANAIIEKIYARNNIPIIMGGTAYYMYNLYKGIPTTPVVPQNIRSTVARDYTLYGIEYLYKKLCTYDPVYAKRISPYDTQRILRATEIHQYTKKPLSFFNETTAYNTHLQNSLCIGMDRNRNTLYGNIDKRVDTMYEQGLFYEVYSLWQHGLNNTHNSFYTIGIQEILENTTIVQAWNSISTLLKKEKDLQRLCTSLIDTETKETVLASIKKNTRNYAKRQLTFFRKLEKLIHESGNNVIWFNLDNADEEKKILRHIHSFIEKHNNN